MSEEIKLWKEKTKGIFNIVEYKKFWNYITNLQQENKRLKEEYVMLQNSSDQYEDALAEKAIYLKRSNEIRERYLQHIADIAFDHDGCNTVEGLKKLIDEIYNYALWGRDLYDWETIYVNEGKEYNILGEEIKENINDEILTEIADFCEECPSHENCPEDECVLYRIEKKIDSDVSNND